LTAMETQYNEWLIDLRDKALRFDLDAAGIAQREAQAVELVEARAEIVRLRNLLEHMACVAARKREAYCPECLALWQEENGQFGLGA